MVTVRSRCIAVSNQKGGVGKTVSCVNLGIGLAQEGKKVLLIDADPQGSLTISLGYEEPDEMEYSLATLMLNIVNDEKLNMEKTILHHKEGVDLIPANIELSAIEVSLVNAMSRELIMRSLIERLREFYDTDKSLISFRCLLEISLGISLTFARLSPSGGQVGYALLTRAPVDAHQKQAFDVVSPRLACVKPVASVHPEPGSNSPL